MNVKYITGLCKIELPSYTIRLSDGARIRWGAETYTARDVTFGVIGSLDALTEGGGDTLPPLEMTLLPPDSSSAATICSPAMQGSRVRFWVSEYTVRTGLVSGTPQLRFDGFLDQVTLNLRNELNMTIISQAAMLFEQNVGNSLSPSWHKSVWSGETGHDNATGLGKPIAWGVESPATSAAAIPLTAPWAGVPV